MPLSHNTSYLATARSRMLAQYQGKPRMDAIIQAFAAEAQALEDAMWSLFEQRLLQNGVQHVIGRATFSGTDRAPAYWSIPFPNTSYLMLSGKAVVTNGGPGVVVAIDNTTKATTGVSVYASAPFTGYVDVLAWEPGKDPIPDSIGGDILDKLGKIVGQPRNGMTDPEYLILITARIVANRSDGKRETLIRLAKLLVPGASVYVKDFPPAAVYIDPRATVTVDPYVIAAFLEVAVSAGVMLMFAWTTSAPANTITAGSIYTSGFTAGPAPTNTGVTAAQSPGSIYASGFASGPPCINDGGGTLPGVIQTEGES